MDNIGEFIHKRRNELGLTVYDIAQAVHVSPSTISKWEKGDIKNLRQNRIKPLADILQLHPAQFFGYTTKKEVDKKLEFLEAYKIPVYSLLSNLTKSNLLHKDNITHYIATEKQEAIGAIKSLDNTSKDKSIMHGDLVLFGVPDGAVNGSLVLIARTNDTPYIAKLLISDKDKYILDNDKLILLAKSDTIVGKIIELRKEII